MINIINKALCCGCSACADACPKGCIKMQADEQGFLFPVTNISECINCNRCNRVCPEINSANNKNEQNLPQAYACVLKDEEKRSKCTSGGVFSALAEDVLNCGGAVFGAAFDSEFNVHHICAENEADLQKLYGSKYVQSDTRGIFLLAQKKLAENKKVLFSGTPCQVAALKGYLAKDYNNLLCVDIVCHSVPSPKVWNKYKTELCGTNNKLEAVNFRSKSTGWINYSYCFEAQLSDGSKVRALPSNSAFMRAFTLGLSGRLSCAECAFRQLNRASDLTLGDFWGVQNSYPQYAEKTGTSLVLVHTALGKSALENVSDKLTEYKTDTVLSLKENPAAYKAFNKNEHRSEFFNNLDAYSLALNPALNTKQPFAQRLKNRIKAKLK